MMNSLENSNLNLYQYIKKYDNPFNVIKAILSYPINNWVNEYFLYTRDFEGGIFFVEYCYSVINYNYNHTPANKYEKWDIYLIMLKLNMLDHLNHWEKYIEYFDLVLTTRPYRVRIYAQNSKYINMRYIISEHGDFLYVHFLWVADRRYEIIKRKISRERAGKRIEHLKRQQACLLSEDEIKIRYETIINRLNYLFNR